MRKRFFIWLWMAGLTAVGSIPAFGQAEIDADHMIVTHQDLVPGAGEHAALMPHATDTVAVKQTAANPDPAGALAEDAVERIWNEIDRSNTNMDKPADVERPGPWSFSTTVGTSFIAFPRLGSAMNMYAAPQLNYAANKRLAFHAGVAAGRTLPVTGRVVGENMMNTDESMRTTGMTNISTYVAASYMLTENLVLHGSGSRNLYMVPVNGEMQTLQFNDLSFGATYNFGNFSIGATIHHSDAPMFGSPFGNSTGMYGTPLYW